MPTVRKLTPEEVRTVEYKGKGQRKLTEEEYDRYLADYEVGDYGEAELAPEEKRLTVRTRFKAAAERRGVALDFKRTTGNLLRFRVQEHNGVQEVPWAVQTPEPTPAPAKRKGGRPKKQAA